MQEPVARRLRLARPQRLGQGEQAQPGGQVRCDRGGGQPGGRRATDYDGLRREPEQFAPADRGVSRPPPICCGSDRRALDPAWALIHRRPALPTQIDRASGNNSAKVDEGAAGGCAGLTQFNVAVAAAPNSNAQGTTCHTSLANRTSHFELAITDEIPAGTAALQPRTFRDQLILGVLVLERRAPRCSHFPQRQGHLKCRSNQHEQRWQQVIEPADGSGPPVQIVCRSGAHGAQE